jgi:hypothetical protein
LKPADDASGDTARASVKSTDIAGVNMPDRWLFRELHWHKANEWA